ncbi:hypothetical protein AVEN_124799-1 [Araneus ventricosus]|uniref:Uncharacterized protein n=1 Tax=Araneus ventricosus TaxID=182803 RepID=A0A4Y2URM1_ARAVE|nr:hypothetical protein AVEN_124799-1 [Araneus ventricosus]
MIQAGVNDLKGDWNSRQISSTSGKEEGIQRVSVEAFVPGTASSFNGYTKNVSLKKLPINSTARKLKENLTASLGHSLKLTAMAVAYSNTGAVNHPS